MEKISVIIPVWCINEEIFQLTKYTLDNLGQTGELIIVDNGSTQGGGFLRSKADVYIRNRDNRGYAYAVNQGLKIAKNNLICLSNNDVIPSSNWQDVAIEVLNSQNVYSCHFRMVNYNEDFNLGTRTWYENKERWCTSSFFVINTTYTKFYYDENYFNSYEDYDYWHTVRLTGLKTAYTNKAAYRHAHSSSKKYTDKLSEIDKKNLEYFISKWGKEPEKLFSEQFPLQWREDYWSGFK